MQRKRISTKRKISSKKRVGEEKGEGEGVRRRVGGMESKRRRGMRE